MKTDLFTSIGAAVLGLVIAFLICNTLLPEIETASFKTLTDSSLNYDLTDPSVEVFNYRALNPTVEVYVGDCIEYDSYGNCISKETQEDEKTPSNTDDIIDTDETDDTEEETNPNEEEPVEENQNGSTN